MAYKFQIGTAYVSGNIELQPDYDLLVDKDGVSDLGTSAKRFANAYVDSYYGDGSNLTGISSDSVDVTGSATDGALMLVGAQTASANGVPLAVPTSDGSTNPSNALLTFKPSTGLLSGSGQIQANSLSLNGAAAISNQGAVTGLTTLAMGGALSGVTTVGASGLASLDGGINTNDDFTVDTDGNVVGVAGTFSGLASLDGGINVNDTLTVSTAGAVAGATTITGSGQISGEKLVIQDGATIGIASDADLLTLAAQSITVAADSSITYGGTAITSTGAELNLVDGSSAGTVVNSKAVIYGGSGQVIASSVSASGETAGGSLNVGDALTADWTDGIIATGWNLAIETAGEDEVFTVKASSGNVSGSGYITNAGDMIIGTGSYYYGDGSKLSNLSADSTDVTSSTSNLSYKLAFTQDLGPAVDLGGNAGLYYNPTAYLNGYTALTVSSSASGSTNIGDGLIYIAGNDDVDKLLFTPSQGLTVGDSAANISIAGIFVGASVDMSGKVDGAAGFDVDGTNIVDSSRNIANIGSITATSVDLAGAAAIGGTLSFDAGSEQSVDMTTNNMTIKLKEDTSGTNGALLIFTGSGGDFMKFDTLYDYIEVKQDFSASCSHVYLGSSNSADVKLVGKAEVASGVVYSSIQNTTGNTTLDGADSFVICSGSAHTITLPASPDDGAVYYVKRSSLMTGSAGDNDLTINGNGNTIDGNSTILLESAGAAVSLAYDSTTDQWNVF